MSVDLSDYIDVAERIAVFREAYPTGSLQTYINPETHLPYSVEVIGEKSFLVVTAYAFRSPDDVIPGIASAWEQVPGQTPYTRNSELQNAETSAWGRAIVAALAADTKRGIATKEDVETRAAEQAAPEPPAKPARKITQPALKRVRELRESLGISDSTYLAQLAWAQGEEIGSDEELTVEAGRRLIEALEAKS